MPSFSTEITIAAGTNIIIKPGLYFNFTYFHSDPIALNDANTEFASSYNLFGGRTGWKKKFSGKWELNIFTGADNLFDEKYSLGNDINAAGGRYYNAAAGRNYFVGVAFRFQAKSNK